MASPSQDAKNAGDSSDSQGSGDSYYNSMVVAAIVAAFALLALIIVTALYLKRTTTYKAIISGDKKSSGMRANGSALPAFKVRDKDVYDCYQRKYREEDKALAQWVGWGD